MIRLIFSIVAQGLVKLAKLFCITYNEINVIVYYFLIPLSWTIMFDYWIEKPLTTILFLCIWIGIVIATHKFFKEWCNWVFEDSVKFLNYFNKFGGNYILNSVIICVVIPLLIYGILIYIIIQRFDSFPINLVRGCIENETLPYIDNLLFISISFEAEMKDGHSIFIVVFIQK